MKNFNNTIVKWDSFQGCENFIRILTDGGIVVAPSDTILGLYAPVNFQGAQRLNDIKHRCNKPYIILVKDWQTALQYGDTTQLETFKYITDACWPGPLTVVVKLAATAPQFLHDSMSTVALRIPRYSLLQRVLHDSDAIFSTSANLAGQPVPSVLEHVNPEILTNVDAIFMDPNWKASSTPSTIIDISSGAVTVIREGAYSREFLETLPKKNSE